jgi:hypothetical protein
MEMEILQKSFEIENTGSGLIGIVASLGSDNEDDDDQIEIVFGES